MSGLLKRGRIWWCSIALSGGVLFAGVPFEGCDQAVKTSLIDGLNAAANGIATTLINAFFISINENDNAAATTVMADVVDAPIFT